MCPNWVQKQKEKSSNIGEENMRRFRLTQNPGEIWIHAWFTRCTILQTQASKHVVLEHNGSEEFLHKVGVFLALQSN